MSPIPILTPRQSADWDAQAVRDGVAGATLMEAAGRAVAALAQVRYGQRLRQGALVACGHGNNGGDGWVIARALHRAGLPVWVTHLDGVMAPLCEAAASRARQDGVREVPPDGPWPSVGLIIDALLGTGAHGAARPPAMDLLTRLADLHLPVLAVDGPSGLDLETGVQHGPLRANLTVTFGGYRRGHLLARDEVGDLVVVDIGLPPADPAWPRLFGEAEARAVLPALSAKAHKGDRGRVVVLGGDPGMTGAARLAARAAFAAGAGLVHAILPEASAAVLATAEPDVQVRVQAFDAPLSDDTKGVLAAADVLVLGPGLGRAEGRAALVLAAVEQARAVVVDADALTALQGHLPALRPLAASKPVVLTPHLGEFRTLFPTLASEAAVDPWHAAVEAAHATAVFVLLKGVPTVIATPFGHGWTVAAGNPGLATGGSGDLLSGLIGTFLAQGVETCQAAALGAQVLGAAADIAAARHTARAMRPMDVVAAVPEVWRRWAMAAVMPETSGVPVLHELSRPRTA